MSDWKTVPIGDLVEPVQTWNPLREKHDEVFDYIDLSAVDQVVKVIVGAREVACGEAPSHRAALDELDRLFASLQHRAFRGEL